MHCAWPRGQWSLISRESGNQQARGCKGDTVTGGVIDFSENANGGGVGEQFVKLSTFHLSQPRAATQREEIDTDLLLRLAPPLSLSLSTSPHRQRLVRQLAIMQVPPLFFLFFSSSSFPFFSLAPVRFAAFSFPLLPSSARWWRRSSNSNWCSSVTRF